MFISVHKASVGRILSRGDWAQSSKGNVSDSDVNNNREIVNSKLAINSAEQCTNLIRNTTFFFTTHGVLRILSYIV